MLKTLALGAAALSLLCGVAASTGAAAQDYDHHDRAYAYDHDRDHHDRRYGHHHHRHQICRWHHHHRMCHW